MSPLAKVWQSETDDRRFRLHWWTAEVTDGEVVMQPGEVSDTRWVTVEEFLKLKPTFAEDREFFERVLPEICPRPAPAAGVRPQTVRTPPRADR